MAAASSSWLPMEATPAETQPEEDPAVTEPPPPQKRQRMEGSKWSWSTRFKEFHQRLGDLKPSAVVDADYTNSETWPSLITGINSKVKGSCSQCKASFDSAIDYLLRKEHPLPNCKCAKGNQQPWTRRYDEFVSRLAEKNGELDPSLSSADLWAQHLQSNGVYVSGKCTKCNKTFSKSAVNDLMKKGLKLPGCICASRAVRKPESFRREKQCWGSRKAEFFEEMKRLRPLLKFKAADDDDAAWSARLAEKGGQTHLEVECTSCGKISQASIYTLLQSGRRTGCACGRSDGRNNPRPTNVLAATGSATGLWQNQEAVLSMVARRHPTVVLDADMRDPASWAAAKPGCFFILQGRCTECGNRVSATISNAKKQGFGGCECVARSKALTAAQESMGATHEINRVFLKQFERQRRYVAEVKCRQCSWTTIAQTRKNRLNRPVCLCTGNASWKSVQGYEGFLELIRDNHKLAGCTIDIDETWWKNNVENNRSLIPFKCTVCGVAKNVPITSIQQGNGMGCSCHRSADLFRKEIEIILGQDHSVQQEWIIGRNPRSGRNLLVDFVAKSGGVDTPWILFELDGAKHFTGTRDGRSCTSTSDRDYVKEIFACERGLTLIRIYQRWIWEDAPGWREYICDSIQYAAANPGGRVIVPDIPEYTTTGTYADKHAEGAGLPLLRDAPFSGGCELRYEPAL